LQLAPSIETTAGAAGVAMRDGGDAAPSAPDGAFAGRRASSRQNGESMRIGTRSKNAFLAMILAAAAFAVSDVSAAPSTPTTPLKAAPHHEPHVDVHPPAAHVETVPAPLAKAPTVTKAPRPATVKAPPVVAHVEPGAGAHLPPTLSITHAPHEPPPVAKNATTKLAPRVVPPVPKVRLFEENVPDPHISVAPSGHFRFVATSGGKPGWLGPFPPDPGDDPIFEIRQTVKPGDLKEWHPVSHVFEKGQRPEWTKKQPRNPKDPRSVEEARMSQHGDFWAPELHTVGKKAVLYFTARDQQTGELAIGVAHTDDPKLQNWKSPPKPLIQLKDMGVIDPTFYQENGESFIVYKTDGNDPKRNAPTEFFVQKLTPDGTALAKGPNGKPVPPIRILRNDPSSWEGINIEAPSVVKIGEWVYVIYSGNMFNTPNYAVGVARAKSLATPMEQWEKLGEPILTNDKGPGHGAPFYDGNKLKYVYHQWRGGIPMDSDIREAYVSDLHVGSDGWIRALPHGSNATGSGAQASR